jgi:hypothetical protein
MNAGRTSSGTPNAEPSPPCGGETEQQSRRERKAQLYWQHPDECPELTGALPYLIHPPSRLSSTASWIGFRDNTVLPMMRHRPDDPNLPKFLKQVEAILAWRAAVPPEDRFWRKDQEGIGS